MSALWMSMRENMQCRSKGTTSVVEGGERLMRRRSCISVAVADNNIRHPTDCDQMLQEAIFRQNYTRSWFYVLRIGNPSRNVVEMIFRAASARHEIEQVLRVNNSMNTMVRFEQYRETIKNRSNEKKKKHPRSMVDGNEQLWFYSTTMNCCTGKVSRVSKLCKASTCEVCSIIQSGFDKAHDEKTEIRLSKSCSEERNEVTNGKNVKKAVIVCRVIAGKVVNMIDVENEDDHDSVAGGKLHDLFVRNSSAVLPCFVIVLN